MKIKHWLIYMLCLLIASSAGIYDSVIRGVTLNQGCYPHVMFGFILGTIGVAVAFLWVTAE